MADSLQPMADGRYWYEVEPAQAVDVVLQPTQAPLNEMGEHCPWPWDPQQLGGAPMGQYHCPYCGGMQVAGIRHLDWRDDPSLSARAAKSRTRCLELADAKRKCHIGERARCCAFLVGGMEGLECGYLNASLRRQIQQRLDEGTMNAKSGPCADPFDDMSEAEERT